MMIETLADELIQACHRAYDKGMVGGSGGNMSLRHGGGFLVTPSGVSLGDVTRENLVTLDPEGQVVGDGKPSKEWPMHAACYRRSAVGAVVHVHSIFTVSAACRNDLDRDCALPVYTPGYSVRIGRLPAIPYQRPGSQELAETVGAVIASRNSVMLANHGVVTVGHNVTAAFGLAEEIEENAHLHFVLNGTGIALNDAEQADLVGRY